MDSFKHINQVFLIFCSRAGYFNPFNKKYTDHDHNKESFWMCGMLLISTLQLPVLNHQLFKVGYISGSCIPNMPLLRGS